MINGVEYPTNVNTRRELIEAYAKGLRFLLLLADGSPLFVSSRAEVDRAKRTETIKSIFYVLPEAGMRPCARGKRTK